MGIGVRVRQSEVNGVKQSEVNGVKQSEVNGVKKSEVKGVKKSEVNGVKQSEVNGVKKSEVNGVKKSEVKGVKQSEVNGQELCKSLVHFLASKFKNELWSTENNGRLPQVSQRPAKLDGSVCLLSELAGPLVPTYSCVLLSQCIWNSYFITINTL